MRSQTSSKSLRRSAKKASSAEGALSLLGPSFSEISPEGAAHRPLGVEQLLFHQVGGAREQRRVHRHHPLRVDQALLALAQALAHRRQLLGGQLHRRGQPLLLLGE